MVQYSKCVLEYEVCKENLKVNANALPNGHL